MSPPTSSTELPGTPAALLGAWPTLDTAQRQTCLRLALKFIQEDAPGSAHPLATVDTCALTLYLHAGTLIAGGAAQVWNELAHAAVWCAVRREAGQWKMQDRMCWLGPEDQRSSSKKSNRRFFETAQIRHDVTGGLYALVLMAHTLGQWPELDAITDPIRMYENPLEEDIAAVALRLLAAHAPDDTFQAHWKAWVELTAGPTLDAQARRWLRREARTLRQIRSKQTAPKPHTTPRRAP